MKILVINPGSTSTKIAVFEDEKEIFQSLLNILKKSLHLLRKSLISLNLEKKQS